MASPQLEDGYTSIANEIIDAIIKINLSPYESRLLWCVIRKTYGYHKKVDTISLTQFETSTNIPHRMISSTLNKLTKRLIIIKQRNHYISEYCLQKDYTLWLSSDSLITDCQHTDSTITDSIITDKPSNKVVIAQSLGSDSPITGGSDSPITESSDSPITNKRKKDTIQKKEDATKESIKIIFYSFKTEQRYNEIDFENEFNKFCEYWLDGNKKIKNPKLACHNWLDHILTFKNNGWSSDNKKPQSNNQNNGSYKINPNQYSDVRDYGKYGTTPTP